MFMGIVFTRFEINITYLRSWALLEEPLIVHPLKNFPAFHGTRGFNTVYTRALHWSLSWALSIQSTPSHPISLVRYILILSTYLRLSLPSGLFPSGFPTNILWAFLFSPIRATYPTPLIHLDLITLIILLRSILIFCITIHQLSLICLLCVTDGSHTGL
jgi:hypothetical protein